MKRMTLLRVAEIGSAVSWMALLYGLLQEEHSWPSVSIIAALGLLVFGLLMALSSGNRV